MRAKVDGGLQHAADRASALHGVGVQWASKLTLGDIAAARQQYANALAYTEANHRTYVLAATILTDVANQIAEQFAHADRNSADVQEKINSLLNVAIDKAQAAMAQGQQAAGVQMSGTGSGSDAGTVRL
jgi:hypothetical protein